MRSATSYFNSTLYRKTMFRFWPLWSLYGLIWIFAIPLNMLNRYFDDLRWGSPVSEAHRQLMELAQNIPQLLTAGVVISCIASVLCAMAVFGYLYNNRSACMMHALPPRREALFLTNYAAGLSMLLLPLLACGVLGVVVELTLLPSTAWSTALPSLGTWLLAQSAVSLFFFSFASFCAMFTGHLLALPAFYTILNGLIIAIYTLITSLMNEFFYGYMARMDNSLVLYATPVYTLIGACHWEIGQVTVNGITSTTGQWSLAAPITIAVYAAVGVAFALLAMVIYRYRHVESAGDVVAIPLVRPIFKCGVSLCSGLCFGLLTAMFFSWGSRVLPLTLCVLFWAAIGWFVAEMLLKKSFRVLHAWRGCVVMVSTIALLCLCCYFDVFGVVKRVPEVSQVASLTISGDLGYPDDGGGRGWTSLTDPQQIAQFVALHQSIVDNRDQNNFDHPDYVSADDYVYLTFSYVLTNGKTLDRHYYSIPVYKDQSQVEGSLTWQVEQINANRELIEQSYDFDSYQQGRLVEAWVEGIYLPSQDSLSTQYLDTASAEQLMDLWQAVKADFDEGTIGVRYLFHDEQRLSNTYRTDLYFQWEMPTTNAQRSYLNDFDTFTSTFCITLTPHATHTLAWLQEFSGLGIDYQLATHEQSGLPYAPQEEYGQSWGVVGSDMDEGIPADPAAPNGQVTLVNP